MATGENDEFKIENIRKLTSLMMFVEQKEKVEKCAEELSKLRP